MAKMVQLELALARSFAQYWLEDLEKSSTTLTAAFHNSAYRTKPLRDMLQLTEKHLQLTPAPDARLEKRLIAVAEAAMMQNVPLDEHWPEILPKLRALADAPDAGRLKTAKASREILRGHKPA